MGKRLERYKALAEDTWQRDQIEPRDQELAQAARPHFLEVHDDLLNDEAESRDRFIRHYLRLSSIEIWRRAGRDNHFHLEFGHGPPTKAALASLEAAISARDPWRFRKSWGAISVEGRYRIKSFIIHNWEELEDDPEAGNFGALLRLSSASRYFSPDDDLFWSKALDVVTQHKEIASTRRRPRNMLGDRVALELACMWSSLSGQPLTLPRGKNGTSE